MTRDSIHIVPTKTDADADASGFSEAPQMSFEISFDEFDAEQETETLTETDTSSCAGRQGSSSLLLCDPEASPPREGPTEVSHSGNHASPLLRKRLFRTAKKAASNEVVPSKPFKQMHFHLRPTFHRLSIPAKKECEDIEPPAVTRSSSSTTTEEPTDTETDHESNHSSSCPSNSEAEAEGNAIDKDNAKDNAKEDSESGLMLFKDERDIVAFQEWPPQRRLRYFHKIHQSPSSVCDFSVETIATKLGRSPVVVSFNKDFPHAFDENEDEDLSEGASNPVSIKGRIGTGRFPKAGEPPLRMDSEDLVEMPTELDRDMVFNHRHNSRDPDSKADSFLNVIESTLFHMMCLD